MCASHYVCKYFCALRAGVAPSFASISYDVYVSNGQGMCARVSLCVCLHAHLIACGRSPILFLYDPICAYVQERTCVCVCVCASLYMCVYLHVCVCVCTCMCVCVCVRWLFIAHGCSLIPFLSYLFHVSVCERVWVCALLSVCACAYVCASWRTGAASSSSSIIS